MRHLSKKTSHRDRNGVVMVLLAVLLPALIVLCAIAINLAKVQLEQTELQIATDVATRAGGTAWTSTGEIQEAIDATIYAASLNEVQNEPVILKSENIIFGNSIRPDQGRFMFQPAVPQPDPDDLDLNKTLITSIQVVGSNDAGLYFEIGNINSIQQAASSVTSQVDRDIALVVDRSGSMVYFEDEQFLYNTITELYDDGKNRLGISGQDYIDAVNDFQGPTTHREDASAVPEDLNTVDIADLMDDLGYPRRRRTLPSLSLNDRKYSNSVLNALDDWARDTSNLALEAKLEDLRLYGETFNDDYSNRNGNRRTAAPQQSRWSVLEQAMDAFVDVLETSQLHERMSVGSFASDATLDLELTDDLLLAAETVQEMLPTGSTRIGDGMNASIGHLIKERRLNAVPTLLVFSDGENRGGTDPVGAARKIKSDYPFVIINTVTFADGDQSEMKEIAEIGGGEHYHANDGDELAEVFEEIARSFSTVITE